ncbi:MAG: hypothetical protein AAB867_01165, partial [Patescibacteria group bacterium]
LIKKDKERRELIQKVEELKKTRNELTKEISLLTLKELHREITKVKIKAKKIIKRAGLLRDADRCAGSE